MIITEFALLRDRLAHIPDLGNDDSPFHKRLGQLLGICQNLIDEILRGLTTSEAGSAVEALGRRSAIIAIIDELKRQLGDGDICNDLK